LQRYWSCSRAQDRLWLARLNECSAAADIAREATPHACTKMTAVLSDILAGDLLCRVWGAVLTAAGLPSFPAWSAPVGGAVFPRRASVRRKALRVLCDFPGRQEEEIADCDRLRRRLDRWTDILVGHLVRRYGLDKFAIDPERAREYGTEQLEDSWETMNGQ